jgi:peptidoglycan/LPS O-acetylase OafA/YrhL
MSEKNGRPSNNFDFIRFVAAFLVIYGHGLAMIGVPYKIVWGAPVSTVGVMMFFAISGYLVTQSWEREPDLIRFFRKRALRIFPALAVCVIVCAIVLGPMFTWLSLREYFLHPTTYTFLKNIGLYTQYFLPGVFDKNPIPGAVNGSLWSLPVEFFCYIVVAALGLFVTSRLTPLILHKASALCTGAIFVAIGYYLNIYYKGPQIVFYATDIKQAATVMPFFFVGAAFYLYRVPLRLDVAVLSIFILFSVEGLGWGKIQLLLNWVLLPYATLSFGTASTPIVRNWGSPGDFSYGMYLYSFPVQQTLVFLYKDSLFPHSLIAYSAAASIAFAFLSWHAVERPALSLKASWPIRKGGVPAGAAIS